MSWKNLSNTNRLPAGTYYVGDTCYVLDDDTYEEMMYIDGLCTNGTDIIGFFPTAYGDGCYKDTKGRSYGVDGGNIGIVPIELCNPNYVGFGTVITIPNEFHFGSTKDFTIWLKDPVNSNNSFEIPTNGEDEEDE